jgi:phage-related protein
MKGTREELRAMPAGARRGIGYALYWAERGVMHAIAKPMKGPDLRGVVEIVEDFSGDTHRAAYIARLPGAVYVLHVFQKKATHGAATPRRHLTMIKQRLQAARRLDKEGDHEARQKNA